MLSYNDSGEETCLVGETSESDSETRKRILPAVGPLKMDLYRDKYISYEELTLPPKEPVVDHNKENISEYVDKIFEDGCRPKLIDAPVKQILKAINQGDTIDDCNISEDIQDPSFRFLSTVNGDVEASYELSQAFAKVVHATQLRTRTIPVKAASKKRSQTADEFAAQMHEVIEKIKEEKDVKTYRATVDALNEKEIPSYTGGKWHIKTLHELYSRWDRLEKDASTQAKDDTKMRP